MIKVKIKATDEVVEVTPNLAYGLIDSGEAVKYDPEAKKPKKKAKKSESNKAMTAGRSKKYKTK